MSAGSIRAAAHAAVSVDAVLPGVRARLAGTPEGVRMLDLLTRQHGGRTGLARAAFDRISDRMLRRVLAAYGEHLAQHAERIERNLDALLGDLDRRRRGEAALRPPGAVLADLEALASSAQQMRTLESFVRQALTEPTGPVLTGVRHEVTDEVRHAIDAIIPALDDADLTPDARTTTTGSARVEVRDDVQRAFADGTPSTSEPALAARERRVRDSDTARRARERAGRTALQVSPTDPRLAWLDLEDLPMRTEDFRRHRASGASPAVAAGRARADALRRLETVLSRTIADAPPLRRHWEDARARVMAGRTVNQIGPEEMRGAAYDATRDLFWAAVAADPHARGWLATRGIEFLPGQTAPVVRTNGRRLLPIEQRRVSLDHLRERALGDNWRHALDADQLALIPSAPNSARESTQVRQGTRP